MSFVLLSDELYKTAASGCPAAPPQETALNIDAIEAARATARYGLVPFHIRAVWLGTNLKRVVWSQGCRLHARPQHVRGWSAPRIAASEEFPGPNTQILSRGGCAISPSTLFPSHLQAAAPQAADAPGYVHLYAALLLPMWFWRSCAYGARDTLAGGIWDILLRSWRDDRAVLAGGTECVLRLANRPLRNLLPCQVAGVAFHRTQLSSFIGNNETDSSYATSVVLSRRQQLANHADTSPRSPARP
ncbi:hypothetical protein R3P38DRAFT_3566346 [Favolaschia claudopus]|uniref:Uncharacterized protein n=1 Tax=Favolaschia claudopus TaxID=2862362 RepID=A0AAW0DZT9_9AGAR